MGFSDRPWQALGTLIEPLRKRKASTPARKKRGNRRASVLRGQSVLDRALRRLSFEQFEVRQLMAGDVVTSTYSGSFDLRNDECSCQCETEATHNHSEYGSEFDANKATGGLQAREGGLSYDSGTLGDTIFQQPTKVKSDGNGVKASSVEVNVQFNGASKTSYYQTGSAAAGDDVVYAVPIDTSGFATGRYPWQMTITSRFADGSYSTESFSGNRDVINRSSSAFGKGWQRADLDELQISGGGLGLNLVTGTGEATWFDYINYTYVQEAGDRNFYDVEVTPGTDTTYKLVNRYGGALEFKDFGNTGVSAKLTARIDASGNRTEYSYFQSGVDVGKLQKITEVVSGRTTNFAYTNGKLSAVDEPGVDGVSRRITSYTYDGSGQLTKITLPDADGVGALPRPEVAYQYNVSGLMTKRTNPNGQSVEVSYRTNAANTNGTATTVASIGHGHGHSPSLLNHCIPRVLAAQAR
jgi:YD repeat-containing protein